MLEFRIHGRGGQGVVTVGHLLAQAFFQQGRFVQTFATHGGERRGTPVTAFVRVADRPIRLRCDVEHPEVVLLYEPTFLEDGTALAGLEPGATLIINTVNPPEQLADLDLYRVATIDALSIARHSGLGRIVNTAMLGAFCRLTPYVPVEQMEAVLRAGVPQKVEENVTALGQAYQSVKLAAEGAGVA